MQRSDYQYIIDKPLSFTEKGRRGNNEDFIYPDQKSLGESDRLFIVCDGVGGSHKGEVASELACTSFSEYFHEHKPGSSDEELLNDAFNHTQSRFDEYNNTYPDSVGMATTLVVLYLGLSGTWIAHCGDSRCYHIRGGKVLWKTFDHTTVHELLKLGIITPEEAAQSARSNRITRAVMGTRFRTVKPDYHQIVDIQSGDYFLLCTDGVWSSFSEKELLEILSDSSDETKKIESIKYLCKIYSDDNYSAILLRIKEIPAK